MIQRNSIAVICSNVVLFTDISLDRRQDCFFFLLAQNYGISVFLCRSTSKVDFRSLAIKGTRKSTLKHYSHRRNKQPCWPINTPSSSASFYSVRIAEEDSTHGPRLHSLLAFNQCASGLECYSCENCQEPFNVNSAKIVTEENGKGYSCRVSRPFWWAFLTAFFSSIPRKS